MKEATYINDSLGATDNVTGRFQPVSASHRPKSVEEVVQLVKSARLSGTPLYPASTGFNWGYGSRSPVTGDCELIDLSGMNRILNPERISIDNPIAIIEPGVTQIQLYEFLQSHAPDLKFNVTGSGKDTSIIGNALDRGVGYLGPRIEYIFGLEIVTGTGEILYTGFRRLGKDSPLAYAHPFGLGPMLDGLFFQSNFGIVTSACFRLLPKRPKEVVISLSLRGSSDLAEAINELARLKRDGLVTSVTHIANIEKSRSILEYGISDYLLTECGFANDAVHEESNRIMNIFANGEWASLASVEGNADQVKAALHEIRSRTKRFGYLKVLTSKFLNRSFTLLHHMRFLSFARGAAAVIYATRPFHNLALGIPTDASVECLLWGVGHSSKSAVELDKSRCGLLFVSPALPMDGQLAVEIIREMKSIASRYHHILYVTINIETTTSLVAVTNLLFDRSSSEEINQAHRCADALLDFIHHSGLEVYRARADMMNKLVTADPDYWKNIRLLKQIYDPDNIIAPGRYNLT